MEKYVLVEWPEYQHFMEFPDFKERCYYCADENVYFVPQSMYNIEMYGKNEI